MQKKFKIGDKTINNGRTFVVAEISANHKGDIKTAKKLIIMAKKSGADAVKIQSYIPESLTINSTNKDFLLKKKINGLNIKIFLIYIRKDKLLFLGTENFLNLLKNKR